MLYFTFSVVTNVGSLVFPVLGSSALAYLVRLGTVDHMCMMCNVAVLSTHLMLKNVLVLLHNMRVQLLGCRP